MCFQMKNRLEDNGTGKYLNKVKERKQEDDNDEVAVTAKVWPRAGRPSDSVIPEKVIATCITENK